MKAHWLGGPGVPQQQSRPLIIRARQGSCWSRHNLFLPIRITDFLNCLTLCCCSFGGRRGAAVMDALLVHPSGTELQPVWIGIWLKVYVSLQFCCRAFLDGGWPEKQKRNGPIVWWNNSLTWWGAFSDVHPAELCCKSQRCGRSKKGDSTSGWRTEVLMRAGRVVAVRRGDPHRDLMDNLADLIWPADAGPG